jgi:hypothetical protein
MQSTLTDGSSWESRADADPYFVREQAEDLLGAYLHGHDPKDPVARLAPRSGKRPFSGPA